MNLFSEHYDSDTDGSHSNIDTEAKSDEEEDIRLPGPHTKIHPTSEEYLALPKSSDQRSNFNQTITENSGCNANYSEHTVIMKMDQYLANINRKIQISERKQAKLGKKTEDLKRKCTEVMCYHSIDFIFTFHVKGVFGKIKNSVTIETNSGEVQPAIGMAGVMNSPEPMITANVEDCLMYLNRKIEKREAKRVKFENRTARLKRKCMKLSYEYNIF